MMRKAVFIKLVIEFFVAVLFVLLVTVTLLHAYGFQYDILERALVKRTIVDIHQELPDVDIYFDGNKVADKAPHKIFNVVPGEHVLKIEKADFLPWEEKFVAKEDLLSRFFDIQLFPKDISKFQSVFLNGIENIFLNDDRVFYVEDAVFKEFDVVGLVSKDLHEFDGSFFRGVTNMKMLDNNSFVFFFKNGKKPVLLRDAKEFVLQVPLSVSQFFSYDVGHLLFLSNGDLFEHDLVSGKSSKLKAFDKSFVKKVEPLNKGFYVLSDSKLVFYYEEGDKDFVEPIFSDRSVKDFKLIRNEKRDKLYVSVLFSDGAGFYEKADDGYDLIDNFYVSFSNFSDDGLKLLYSDGYNLKIYDLVEKENVFLTRFASRVLDMQWFRDSYIIYKLSDSNESVCDDSWHHCYLLSENAKNMDFKYFFDEDVLVSLSVKGLSVYEF